MKKLLLLFGIALFIHPDIFAQTSGLKRLDFGAGTLYPEKSGYERRFTVYGEYRFTDVFGAGLKYGNGKTETAEKRASDFQAYFSGRMQVNKEAVILKSFIGAGYHGEYDKLLVSVSVSVNFFFVPDHMYGGIISDNYWVWRHGAIPYSGILLGVCF